MTLTTADRIADYILCHFHDRGDDISHLKLQKLVYYAQGWFLGLHGEELFKDRLEAWVHGPVQPELYQRFEQYKYHPITEEKDCRDFSEKRIKKLLDYILDRYGHFSASQLENMTHEEPTWLNARNGLSPDENGNEIITVDSMKEFFENELKREEYEEKQSFIRASDQCFNKALDEVDKDIQADNL